MGIKEKIKQKIIDYYNSNKTKGIISIEKPAFQNIDPYLVEFQKEILQTLKETKEEIPKIIIDKLDFINKTEEVETDNKEDAIDIKVLDVIEEKVSKILNYLNMDLYRFKKEELKNVIISDMLESMTSKNLSVANKIKIASVVVNLVEHEFNEYESKKQIRKKDLLTNIFKLIMPKINEYFEIHKNYKLKKLTNYQKQNFIKSILKSIEQNYLNKERETNNINNEEYVFLKTKIKTFILLKYSNYFENRGK